MAEKMILILALLVLPVSSLSCAAGNWAYTLLDRAKFDGYAWYALPVPGSVTMEASTSH